MRLEITDRLGKLPQSVFIEAGRKAAITIPESEGWRKCGAVLLFMSMKNEIDTTPLLHAAFSANKKVFLPLTINKESAENRSGKIQFYRIYATGFNSSDYLKRGPFGILEPDPGKTKILRPADFPVFILTPGLAFDRNNNRLGRGKGYYDRFFAEIKELDFTAAGLCLETQIVQSAPSDGNDYRVDRVYIF